MPGLASSPPAAALRCDLLAPGSCVCWGITSGSRGIPTRPGTDPPSLAHASSWEFALEASASGPGRQVWLADTHWPHPVISRQGYFRPDLDSGPASVSRRSAPITVRTAFPSARLSARDSASRVTRGGLSPDPDASQRTGPPPRVSRGGSFLLPAALAPTSPSPG